MRPQVLRRLRLHVRHPRLRPRSCTALRCYGRVLEPRCTLFTLAPQATVLRWCARRHARVAFANMGKNAAPCALSHVGSAMHEALGGCVLRSRARARAARWARATRWARCARSCSTCATTPPARSAARRAFSCSRTSCTRPTSSCAGGAGPGLACRVASIDCVKSEGAGRYSTTACWAPAWCCRLPAVKSSGTVAGGVAS